MNPASDRTSPPWLPISGDFVLLNLRRLCCLGNEAIPYEVGTASFPPPLSTPRPMEPSWSKSPRTPVTVPFRRPGWQCYLPIPFPPPSSGLFSSPDRVNKGDYWTISRPCPESGTRFLIRAANIGPNLLKSTIRPPSLLYSPSLLLTLPLRLSRWIRRDLRRLLFLDWQAASL